MNKKLTVGQFAPFSNGTNPVVWYESGKQEGGDIFLGSVDFVDIKERRGLITEIKVTFSKIFRVRKAMDIGATEQILWNAIDGSLIENYKISFDKPIVNSGGDDLILLCGNGEKVTFTNRASTKVLFGNLQNGL